MTSALFVVELALFALLWCLCDVVDAQAYLRRGVADGFPVHMIDASSPERVGAINALAAEIIPNRWFFGTRQDNKLLCERTGFPGWPSAELRRGARPPAETIAAWIRSPDIVRQALTCCPQVVMLVLLFHMQNVIRRPEAADLREAGQVHLQYLCLKDWFFHETLPDEPWQALLEDWPIQSAEDNMFRMYKRLLSSTYNALQPGDLGDPGLAYLDATEDAEGFYEVCPQARGAAHIRVLAGAPTANGSAAASGAGPLADVVEGLVPFGMALVGNALSLYWQARGIAALASLPFRGTGGLGSGFFVEHLPRTAGAPGATADVAALRETCVACHQDAHWRWPHLCLGAWSRIKGAIHSGTLGALRLSGAEAVAQALLGPNDVAVHMRCFPFFSGEYPLASFSLLSALPPQWAARSGLRFLLISGTLGPVCREVVDAMEAHLRRRYPQAEVVRRFNTTAKLGVMAEDVASSEAAQLDFAILAHAPVLIRTPSTFSLWAALARGGDGSGPGLVLSAPNPPRSMSGWEWQTADFGAGWTWVSSPLLTPDVVARQNFSFERPGRWIRWLEAN